MADRIQLSREILVGALGDAWPEETLAKAAKLLASGEGKFPAGVRGLPQELIRAVQRERLLQAMLIAAAELGYRETNVQEVIDRAGVSRPTFYEHFANKEDCFLVAFDAGASRLRERIRRAAEGDAWRERLRQRLRAVLEFAAEEPATAGALIVEARGASADAVGRRVLLLEDMARCLEAETRRLLAPEAGQGPVTAAGVVGGIEAILYTRLRAGQNGGLLELMPALMYFAVLPYEGAEAAREELAATG